MRFASYRILSALLHSVPNHPAQSLTLLLRSRNRQYICRSAFDVESVADMCAGIVTIAISHTLSCFDEVLLLKVHCFFDRASFFCLLYFHAQLSLYVIATITLRYLSPADPDRILYQKPRSAAPSSEGAGNIVHANLLSPISILLRLSSLPKISRISIAPPGVTVLPATAILAGHITVPFLTSSFCAKPISASWMES